jgi:hypothetical protein
VPVGGSELAPGGLARRRLHDRPEIRRQVRRRFLERAWVA